MKPVSVCDMTVIRVSLKKINEVLMKYICMMFGFFFSQSVLSVGLSTEDIFSHAEKYTLKLRTDISIPFIHDDKGSFKGTGFLVNKKKGWILTNAHVAGRSPSKIEGMFKGGEYYKLNKIYIDPVIDLAILKIDSGKIPANASEAELDCESEYRTGHPIGTYGHPWEVSFTATRGIISGVTYVQEDEWIQVDAPINHGNSGGPLISLETGKVIGINSAVANDDKTEGLNFALPIRSVCTVIELLNKGIDPSPINLGIIFYKSEDNSDLKVAYVDKSINKAIQKGDIIKSVSQNNKLISTNYLMDVLRGKDKFIDAVVERNEKEVSVALKTPKIPPVLGAKGIYFSGMLLTTDYIITDATDINQKGSWLVNHVDDGSSAVSNGISEWVFIEEFNNKSFRSVNSLYEYLNSIDVNSTIKLEAKWFKESDHRNYGYEQIEVELYDLERITINK